MLIAVIVTNLEIHISNLLQIELNTFGVDIQKALRFDDATAFLLGFP